MMKASLALAASLLVAQTPTAPSTPKTVEATRTEDPTDLAYLIGKELRCPVCQGMPVADSPSDMAQDMMKRIREMTDEGKSKQEVMDYFTQSYGDWVLLRPKAQGVNHLVWVLPPLFVLIGFVWVASYVRRSRGEPEPGADPSENDKGTAGQTGGDNDDDYLRTIRAEVEQ